MNPFAGTGNPSVSQYRQSPQSSNDDTTIECNSLTTETTNSSTNTYCPPLSQDPTMIQFKNVHFTYPSRPTQPILRDINLNIKTGSTVAIVGASGCGKSTIIALMERLYDPDEGIVICNGIDLSSRDIFLHRRYDVGIVTQEPVSILWIIFILHLIGDKVFVFRYHHVKHPFGLE